ncbi:MAG: hypothetical protein O2795_11810, partial [Acidobacteria bacterium]|nr:hypothetical protein [Acidobacteriota bacterium]
TKIVFTSARDGNGEIYVMNADGSEPSNLTNTPGDGDALARWSPNGTKIAYNSTRNGVEQIAVMNADGSFPLTKTNEQALLSDARWSPNGAFIAYAANRIGRISILVMDTVDFDKVNLTLDLDSSTDPQWSPDGMRIAFTSGLAGSREIYVMNADGSNKINLTNSPGDDESALWSPDGSRILFSSARDGNDEIYVMNADGSAPQNLTANAGGDGFAQWSPDGSRIVFSSNRDAADLDLYIMNADGSNVTRLTTAAGNDFNPQLFGNFSFGQPPAIFADGVILANLAPKVETISPLSIISIFGMDLSSETILFPNLDGEGRIDTILGGTCVEIGGERAPIFAITPTQANVQTPGTPTAGPVGVVMIRDCDTPLATRSSVEMVTMSEATPGFFIFNPVANDGFIAARFNDGFAAVAPDALFSDQFGPSRPAKPGDIMLLFGTGWGETDPALATGRLASGAATVLDGANPMVTVGGIPLAAEDILYVGVTPGTAGLFQLAIRIPEGTTPGNKQVVLTVYGKSTPVGPVIPVAAN